MNIQTVFEGKRGCGYRKAGGLYLRTDGHGRYCGALPVYLNICPTCHQGIKPARGWTWINLAALVDVNGCTIAEWKGCGDCPIADAKIQDVGLIWIGEKFYPTPEDFNRESHAMGLSRRITTVPRNFKLGETWVALAHRKVASVDNPDAPNGKEWKAGIFHVFKPSRIEYVVKTDDAEDKLETLEKRGITLVKVINPEELPLQLPEPQISRNFMTAAQRANIGRGVKYAAMRKRQSEAMKASWARRRANNGVNPVAAIYDSVHASREAAVATKRDNLHKVAQLLGIDTDEVIRDEIRKALVV